jgi:hypothetical protein
MNNFYAMSQSEMKPRPNRMRLSQFLSATVAVVLFGGVMYAAALVAHSESRVNPVSAPTQQGITLQQQ